MLGCYNICGDLFIFENPSFEFEKIVSLIDIFLTDFSSETPSSHLIFFHMNPLVTYIISMARRSRRESLRHFLVFARQVFNPQSRRIIHWKSLNKFLFSLTWRRTVPEINGSSSKRCLKNFVWNNQRIDQWIKYRN